MADKTNDKPDLVKDKECVYCQKMFECKGKMRGVTNCVNFEQYKDDKYGVCNYGYL